MDTLTSFLLNEDSALAFDSFNENVLQNLPHQAGQWDILDPLVPFADTSKYSAGMKASAGMPAQSQLPWDMAQLQQAPANVNPIAAPPDFLAGASVPQSQLMHVPSDASAFGPSIPLPVSAAAGGAAMPAISSDSSGGGQQQQPRREDPDISRLHERIQKQKEKNARNQRQFRKRAKERAQKVEEQVQALSARLAQLETEKSGLAARNAALETALSSARDSEATLGAARGASLASLVAAAAAEGEELDAASSVTLHVREGQPLSLSAERLGRMAWPELVRIWKEYINAIAMGLVTAGREEPASPGMQRLKVLINDIMCLMKGIALHNTLLIHQHSSCRMDGGPHSAPDQKPPPPGFYQTILASLALTPEQKEAMLAHRQIKLSALARLVQERREIQASLQARLLPSSDSCCACNEAAAQQKDMPCLRHEFPWLLDVTQRLNANVAALHRAICLFMGQTWRQVLTPIQAGTFMVQTFPYAPDMLALANEVAAEARAPTVAQVFAGVLGGSAEGSTPSSGLSAAATPRSSS